MPHTTTLLAFPVISVLFGLGWFFALLLLIGYGLLYRKYVKARESQQQTLIQLAEYTGMMQERCREAEQGWHQLRDTFDPWWQQQQQLAQKSQAEQIDLMLKPMSEQCHQLREQLSNWRLHHSTTSAQLEERLRQLTSVHQLLHREATALTKALKGDSRQQGAWGELLLEQMLSRAGWLKQKDYLWQPNYVLADMRRVRPDCVLCLPGHRHLIIDAKVAITDLWHHAEGQQQGNDHSELGARLAQRLRSHIKDMNYRCYHDIRELNSMGMVVLFLPVESALSCLLAYEPHILEETHQSNLLLATPSSFWSVVTLISQLWSGERTNQHAVRIAEQAGLFYDELVRVFEQVQDTEKKIQQALDSVQQVQKRLWSGRGNLATRAQKLQTLGVKSKRSLPHRPDETDDVQVLDE